MMPVRDPLMALLLRGLLTVLAAGCVASAAASSVLAQEPGVAAKETDGATTARLKPGVWRRFATVLLDASEVYLEREAAERALGRHDAPFNPTAWLASQQNVPEELNFLVQIRGSAPAPGAIPAPFKLTPAEREARDAALAAWDARNQEMQNLQCTFHIWTTGDTLASVTHEAGWLKYQRPYRGEYSITHVGRRDATGKVQWRPSQWGNLTYTGDAWFYADPAARTLFETRLPDALNSSTKRFGSVALLYDLTSAELRERFFFRVITKPEDRARGEIWLEAIPRGPQPKHDMKRAELILTANDHRLHGLKLVFPGSVRGAADYEVCYLFTDYQVNRPSLSVLEPKLPEGWRREACHPADSAPAVVADKPDAAVEPTPIEPAPAAAPKTPRSRAPEPYTPPE